ncbi:uncharacterized protein [Parasteatoda tepidariorum]|uniref:uncharacterized protein n=1 Tax=Parasteatoda tepidariorum TaxID=114398 RepID=UPI0039BCCDC5
MTSTRIIFLLTIATSIYLVHGDLFANLKTALADAENKLYNLYGDDKVSEVENTLEDAGNQIVGVISKTIQKIQEILGLTQGKKDQVENTVQSVNTELDSALNGVKGEIEKIFHAAKKGGKLQK